jgi:hypothetical protein
MPQSMAFPMEGQTMTLEGRSTHPMLFTIQIQNLGWMQPGESDGASEMEFETTTDRNLVDFMEFGRKEPMVCHWISSTRSRDCT